MQRKCNCLRCGKPMQYALSENLQLGKTSFLLGDWPNLIAGAIFVEIYCCPACGKLEFFAAESKEHTQSGVPQVTCPHCGRSHDFDYPSCPYCKHPY